MFYNKYQKNETNAYLLNIYSKENKYKMITNNINEYGYKENNSLYTWLEETRDWRKHEHEHLEEAKTEIMNNTDEAEAAIIKEVDDSKTEILNKIEEYNTYVVTNIVPKVTSIQKTVEENKTTLANIWNKIRTAVFS